MKIRALPASPVFGLEFASLPCWASQVALVVKNPPAHAGDIRDAGSRDLFSTLDGGQVSEYPGHRQPLTWLHPPRFPVGEPNPLTGFDKHLEQWAGPL